MVDAWHLNKIGKELCGNNTLRLQTINWSDCQSEDAKAAEFKSPL